MTVQTADHAALATRKRDGVLSSLPSFSQWVRERIRGRTSEHSSEIGLYESSVAEPTQLLMEKVRATFGETISPCYQSVFTKGNPYVLATVAENHGVTEDHVLCTTGATGALSLIYRAFLQPGDRILIENPAFDVFRNIGIAMGNPVDNFQRSGEDFAIDMDDLVAQITERTRLIVISNLHNPSGMAIEEDTLRALAAIAEAHELYIVVDEVYSGYAKGAIKPAASLGISPRLISISSLTKMFGLSTLRCGWIVTDPKTLGPIRAWNREVEFAISKLSHAVAAEVLKDPDPFSQYSLEFVDNAKPILSRFHQAWLKDGLVAGRLPDYGCIALLRLPFVKDTVSFCRWLMKQHKVVVVPGEYFGAPGHIRIGFALDETTLETGLTALTNGLIQHRDVTVKGETA